jgi:ComF family protein
MPPTCILCHFASDREQDLCAGCLAELPILPQSWPSCAKNIIGTQHDLHVLFSYQTPINKLIMELKFHEKIINARILGELLLTTIKTVWYADKELPTVLLPMPLHFHRLRSRGFNQAVEIARPIARGLNIPLNITGCQRSKNTVPQAMLQIEKRRQNLQNAFTIKENFAGQHIAVLDDVITTGHTLAEFIQSLARAGAAKIDVWCCAQTLT